jgi:hypothetical protein
VPVSFPPATGRVLVQFSSVQFSNSSKKAHAFRLFLRTSRRLGSGAVSRFDSLLLHLYSARYQDQAQEWSCTRECAQGEGIFLYIARYEAMLAPRIGAEPFLANRFFTTWGPAIVTGSHFSLLESSSTSEEKAGIHPTYQTLFQKVVTSSLPTPIA